MNEEQPYFSILMCVYNKIELLYYSIASVLNQSEQSFELLILDNSDINKEASWGILQKFALQDSRIKIYQNEVNQGWAKGASDLLKVAKGRYMTFLAADDFLLPDALSEVRSASCDYGADMVWIGNKFYQFQNDMLQELGESVPQFQIYESAAAHNIAEIMRTVFYNSFFHYVRIDFLNDVNIDFFDSHYGDCAGMTHALSEAKRMVVLNKALYGLTGNTSQSRGTFYIDGEQYIFVPQWNSIKNAYIRDNIQSYEELQFCAVEILRNQIGNLKSLACGEKCVDKYMQLNQMNYLERLQQIQQVLENETVQEMAYFYGRHEYEQEMLEAIYELLCTYSEKQELPEIYNPDSWLGWLLQTVFLIENKTEGNQADIRYRDKWNVADVCNLSRILTDEKNVGMFGMELFLKIIKCLSEQELDACILDVRQILDYYNIWKRNKELL